jgi:hydrogenase/urease accessory protein HupE
MRKQILQVLLLLLISAVSSAHEIRPGYLEIKENQDHSLNITWKQPLMGEYGVPLHPSISGGWMVDSLARISYTESYLIKRWMIPPEHAPLDEQTIHIAGLEKTITDVLVEINLLNDVSFTYLIKPIQPFVKLNLSNPSPPPVMEYLQLGILHIWSGIDHLLFILALLLLVKKRSTLIWTITSFTLAHSITLALATLNIIKVSSAFTEASIALSIVFLAVEILRHYKNQDGFVYHYPWIVAFMFGLLHGLGFAGALQDLGLPENNILYALFLFNAGVELGQLAFVFVILFLIAVIRKLKIRKLQWTKYAVPYFIGTLAMYWVIERVIVMLNL